MSNAENPDSNVGTMSVHDHLRIKTALELQIQSLVECLRQLSLPPGPRAKLVEDTLQAHFEFRYATQLKSMAKLSPNMLKTQPPEIAAAERYVPPPPEAAMTGLLNSMPPPLEDTEVNEIEFPEISEASNA